MNPLTREADVSPGGAGALEAAGERALFRLAILLQGAGRLDDVIAQIVRGAAEALGAARARVHLCDPRTLTPPAGRARSAAEPTGSTPGEEDEILRAATVAMRPLTLEDSGRPERSLRLDDPSPSRRRKGHRTAVPLFSRDDLLGILVMEGGPRVDPVHGPGPLVAGFAAQAGPALGRALQVERRDRHLREMMDLHRTAASLQPYLPLTEILLRLAQGVTEGLGVDRAVVFLSEDAGAALRGARAAVRRKEPGPDLTPLQEALRDLIVPVGDPREVLSLAALTRRPVVLEEHAAPNGLALSPRVVEVLQTHSVTAVPLVVNDRVLGILTIDNAPARGPIGANLSLLTAYAAQGAAAIERTLAEEEVRASERRYREFLERSPDGVVESTLDGRILSVNEGILRMLGYTREEMIALNARTFYANPDQRDELIKRNSERGLVESMDVAVKRKDGGRCYVNVSTRLRRGDGEPVLECIVRDATERFELERRARLLADAVTYSADAIISLDPSCRITSWNVGAEALFGFTAAEMLGKTYQTIVPQDLMDEFCNVIRARVEKEGRLQGYETERLHRSGQRIPVSLTVTRLSVNGGPDLGWSVVVRDVTEKRREEERRRLLSAITEQSPDAILSVDRAGRVTAWNRGAETMFGYTAAEMVGRPWIDLAPPDREGGFRAMTATGADAAGATRESGRSIDTLARARDGRLLPVRLSSSVLRFQSGGEMGWSVILRDLTEQRTLAEMSERLQEELYNRNRLEGIVGHSRVMEEVRERIRRVARFNSSVMIIGSSGTGKELVANAIHDNSQRRRRAFIKVNCAAIPEELLESELFGIERNVATGVDGRIGRFEMADGGTLLLDEIGDMSLATQAKILRVLQEREFERVGGKKVIKVDVRIIAATNKDLEAEIKARRFRDDLFYRLNVIVVTLPPLADRREDIDPLIDHFLETFTRENELLRKRFSLTARMLLNEYPWPGNVRELEHCVERAVVMSEGSEITESDLPPSILIWKDLGGARTDHRGGWLPEVLRRVEHRAVVEALERCDWVQAKAARLLGISERSMWYRVKKLEIRPPGR